ncbi:MAG: 2-polyprenylphenol 6-hydroxylase [Alphaproteobacteria bacterium]|nr:2-polyprenylphenol 6-hydroxylase [Alphaproteobacteria bacterium]
MLNAPRHTLRLIQLAYTFGRCGAAMSLRRAGFPVWFCQLFSIISRRRLPKREGERLRLALAKMGPTFIKLGQALSTRSDLVGEEVAKDLAQLQDRIAPFSTPIARRIIEEGLEKPINELFSEFSDTPVAAASIAQVHFATTIDGHEVAVKVLRPGIREAFDKDIGLFYWIAEAVEQHLPETRRLKPVEIVRTFEDSIARELDLRMEAAAGQKLRDNTLNDEGFYIPEVDWSRSCARVLTMERIEGIPISDVQALRDAGHDMDDLIAKAANTLFKQVFRDGFFHADLHPGNLFVSSEGNLIAVDFGITGRLDTKSQLFIAEILRAFLSQDYKRVAEVHIMAGYVPPDQSVEDFALACMAIGKPILGKPLHDISVGQLLGQLFTVSALFEMETQPQLLLLQKNMMLAEGVGRMLNPHINMWKLAEPLIENWAQHHLSLEGRVRLIADEAYEVAKRLPVILRKIDEFSHNIDGSGMKIHPETLKELQQQRSYWHKQWLTLAWVAVLGAITLAVIN